MIDKNQKSKNPKIPEAIFDLLLFCDTDLNGQGNKPYLILTYLPYSIYYQRRHGCKTAVVLAIITPGTKMKGIAFTLSGVRQGTSGTSADVPIVGL